MGNLLFALTVLGAATAFAVQPETRAKAPRIGRDFSPEERRRLIEPVAAGELRIEPLFRTAGITLGLSREPKVTFEYRPVGKGGEWLRPAVAPVHFPEQDNWRGMLFDLEEDTEYDFRAVTDAGTMLVARTFRTWKTDVPIAETVYFDENTRFPIVISGKGRPDGWIRYTTKPGVTLVNSNEEFYTDYHGPVNVVGAEYVVLDDMRIVGGECRRMMVLMYSHDVRVRNCELSGWGVKSSPQVDVAKFHVPDKERGRQGEPIRDAASSAVLIYKGMRNTVLERCWIHDPIQRSVAWRYYHPFGPCAVVVAMPDCATSIRYNDFVGSDAKPWDDCVTSWGNFSPNGGFNRTAEVYGNFFIFPNDDCLEIDGGEQCVAVFGNRFETGLVGLSLQGNSVSPSYAYGNLFAGMGDEFGECGQTVKTSQFDPHLKGVYSAVWGNVMWKGGSGINVMHASEGSPARIDCFDNVFCDGQELRGAELATHALIRGNRTGVRMRADELPRTLPLRPLDWMLDAVRIDVADDKDRSPRKVRFVGGRGERFTVVKNESMDWFEVSPTSGEARDGVELTIGFKAERMTERPICRGAFLVRTETGLSRPVSLYVCTDWKQPLHCERPGDVALYADPNEVERDADGFGLYEFKVPKKGRYYLMSFAQAPKRPLADVALDVEAVGTTMLQTCPDYPVWGIVANHHGNQPARRIWGTRVRWYDLEPGVHRLRFRCADAKARVEALLLTDNPLAFEPKTVRVEL